MRERFRRRNIGMVIVGTARNSRASVMPPMTAVLVVRSGGGARRGAGRGSRNSWLERRVWRFGSGCGGKKGVPGRFDIRRGA